MVYSLSRGRRRAMPLSVSLGALALPTCQGSGLQHGADRLGGFADHRIGRVRVFHGGFGAAVSEQPAYRQNGFPLSEGEAGMGVTQVVKPHVVRVRLPRGPDARNTTTSRPPDAGSFGVTGKSSFFCVRAYLGRPAPVATARPFSAPSCCRAERGGRRDSPTSAASRFRSCGSR